MHVGGYNLSDSHLGLPDVGYFALSGTVVLAGHIPTLPVIANDDDGYGNHLNTGRLIAELERAGLAELHIENQVFPKRCGHMAGKRLVFAEAFTVALLALYNWCYGGKSPLLLAERISYMDNKFVLSTDDPYAVPNTLIELYDEIKQHWTNLGYASACCRSTRSMN